MNKKINTIDNEIKLFKITLLNLLEEGKAVTDESLERAFKKMLNRYSSKNTTLLINLKEWYNKAQYNQFTNTL